MESKEKDRQVLEDFPTVSGVTRLVDFIIANVVVRQPAYL